MKRVRFDAVEKVQIFEMNDSECHSPRPFDEREMRTNAPNMAYNDSPRVLPYQSDPLQRYENSNSYPYPTVTRTYLTPFISKEPFVKPCDDLDLSLLDDSSIEPRKHLVCKSILKETDENKLCGIHMPVHTSEFRHRPSVLSSVENNPPNVLVKDNSFFIRRDNLNKYNFNVNPLQTCLTQLSIGKENDPIKAKAEILTRSSNSGPNILTYPQRENSNTPLKDDICECHHCKKSIISFPNQEPLGKPKNPMNCHQIIENIQHSCACSTPRVCSCCNNIPPVTQQNICKSCNCYNKETTKPHYGVHQKTLAIEKYEKAKGSDCMEVEKQTNLSKEKREPTVADLFKIIKLQNEQLQLLQEKVDKFISSSHQNTRPTTHSTEHVAINAVGNDHHKMSVGVMTSFEMIRTSTVINKEMLKHSNENSQILCNRSHVSIKDIVSSPVNLNFLEGIAPKNIIQNKDNQSEGQLTINDQNCVTNGQQPENGNEDKTLNELSLYNLQVDNATTPLMSPEQTMYLDIRDYSDSEASNTNQSNVGWTYYNKVMTHVNGMLQDSEMPSSASAMYRNMRQQCLQMQFDKTNVSVTKRVKFGDDPVGLRQPHIYAPPATDTSLKMNQLAAKYLNKAPVQAPPRQSYPAPAQIDMSFATRNYMEKHRLLQGLPAPSNIPQVGDIPRFLDITALKKQQQQKFL